MAPHFRSDLAEGILRSWHPAWVTARARCRTRQARRGAIASVVPWTAGYETRPAGRSRRPQKAPAASTPNAKTDADRLWGVAGSPVDAVLGEPDAVPWPDAAGLGGARIHCGGLQAAGPADMSRPFVARLEHDLLELRRPAKQQPPAALGARPLLDARRQRPRPRHLMWGGQPNSDLQQAPS